MFIDARTLSASTRLEGDICILGAGAAGITLARELAGSSYNVILLESGGFDFDPDTQALYKGEIAGHYYPPLDTARLRFFGGSTNHWDGNCTPLDTLDFEARDWVDYSGWPLSRTEMGPFYTRAQPYCQLGPYRYDPTYWTPIVGGPPMSLPASKAETNIAQLSPPTRFGEVYRADLDHAANVRVVLHANVLEIVPAAGDSSRIDHVEVAVLKGARFTVAAKQFVLAMGGIENPRQLLLSNSRSPAGLGNQNDLVGRFFMEHPVVDGALFLPSRKGLNLKLYGETVFGERAVTAFLQVADAALRRHKLTNVRAPLDPTTRYRASEGILSFNELVDELHGGPAPVSNWTDVKEVIEDFDMVLEAGARKLLNRHLFPSAEDEIGYDMDTMIEQVPNPESRVTLAEERDALGQRRVRLDWQVEDKTKQNLWRCFEILAQAVGEAGVGRIRSRAEHTVRLWSRERLNYGFHHMGTTRMHSNPAKGVVDADCRVHGLKNLFIAGSSVFPTGGHVPPTLTIVALAIRLADHLKTLAGDRS